MKDTKVSEVGSGIKLPCEHCGFSELAQADLIKREKLQLLKAVEGCVPKEMPHYPFCPVTEKHPYKECDCGAGDHNKCRTQIIKSIKELGEEL